MSNRLFGVKLWCYGKIKWPIVGGRYTFFVCMSTITRTWMLGLVLVSVWTWPRTRYCRHVFINTDPVHSFIVNLCQCAVSDCTGRCCWCVSFIYLVLTAVVNRCWVNLWRQIVSISFVQQMHETVACNSWMKLFHETVSYNSWMKLFHAMVACNSCMKQLHASVSCNGCMKLFHTTVGWNCFMQRLHATVACKCFMQRLHCLFTAQTQSICTFSAWLACVLLTGVHIWPRLISVTFIWLMQLEN